VRGDTTSSSSSDFCVLRLWNSLRESECAEPGNLFDGLDDLIVDSGGDGEALAVFRMTSVSARRCAKADRERRPR